tara:strand:+ start:8592 stop:9764 length:1173 start_codon:yes stop_codon:yes gene_type:complete
LKIPIARTHLTDEEIESVQEPLRSGWLVQGPYVKEFEDKWSIFVGVKNSIAVTSCTSALHLSLAATGFKAGDTAIVPAFTWISTANVVEHLGGSVIFCDIDPVTFNIDVKQIEEKILPTTKAILPVHLFGLSADMDPIVEIANAHNLSIIEDAACGFGSRYKGKHVGALGNTGCFSFHPRKSITTGEGGMITTNDDKLASKLRELRDHGAGMSDLQRHLGPKPFLLSDHKEAGYNQRMTDIQAVLGSSQMNRAKEIIDERRKIASKYNEAFKSLDWLQIPFFSDDYDHGYQSYPCMIKTEDYSKKNIESMNLKRNNWMEMLQDHGISTRPATHSVHMLTYYKEKYLLNSQDYINSYIANECSISLPLFNGMTEEESDYVIDIVTSNNPFR